MTKDKKDKVPTGNTGTRARIHEDKKPVKVIIGKKEKPACEKKKKK